MKILVKVRQEVINESSNCPLVTKYPRQKDLDYVKTNCMVSVAIREIFPNAITTTFYELDRLFGEIHPFGDQFDPTTSIDLPQHAVEAIKAFDSYSPSERISLIKPFEFQIDVPEIVIEKIGIDEVKQVLSKSATLQLV